MTKYSGSSEDNNVANNSGGATTFIAPSAVDIVPFDNGYYAEFSVTSFSEFWLNGGGALQNQPLPVTWLSFTATREGKNALLTWRTATEERTDRFEVEAANSAGSFERIGSVKAAGNSTAPRAYIFTDTRTGLCETQLYRLREYDLDGNSNYSIIRPLAFVCGNGVQIYPNPSSGLFEVILEVGSSFDTDVATVVDMAGRELWQTHLESDTHTRQHLTVDLSAARFASGVYTLHIGTNVFRLVKL